MEKLIFLSFKKYVLSSYIVLYGTNTGLLARFLGPVFSLDRIFGGFQELFLEDFWRRFRGF